MSMTEAQRAQFFAMRKALDGFVSKIVLEPAEINENTVAIREWKPGPFSADDVRMFAGTPRRCIQPHDSTNNPDWTPDAALSLWMEYHGTSKATARPWIAPTGAHDMYRAGEWMIWTDGLAYPCLADTIYTPTDYPAAWGTGETIEEACMVHGADSDALVLALNKAIE